jgi:hypothetical protein
MKTRLRTTSAAVLLALGAAPAMAVDNVVLNGFMTAGATYTDSDTQWFNGNIRDEIGFEQDSRVGLQVAAQINPKMSVTVQVLGRAREEDFDAFFDWGFVSYTVNEAWELRAGKIKFPTFLISDYIEVGYAYPWIRPPQEVYTSNPLTAISGADALFRARLGDADLLLQPYVGTSRGQSTVVPQGALEFNADNGSPFPFGAPGSVEFVDFEARNLIGINASMNWDHFSVRAGYLSIETSADALGVRDEDTSFWSVGGTMDLNNFIGYAEYFEREIEGGANLGFPNQKGYYATLGYRMGKWMPHLTYAKLDENGTPSTCGGANPFPCGEALKQDSVTLGVRYELGAGAALKAEAQRVSPDGRGLFTGYDANGNSVLDDNAMIYSIAIDVVF